MSQPIKLDIWSDIVCPWCYIGKRRMETGLAEFADTVPDAPPVEIEYHSFQLSPDMPGDFEGTAAEYLARHKGIPEAQARQMQDHVVGLAAAEGLAYDFERLRPANTASAHQLLHLAKDRGVQSAVKERVMAAHFLEGRHVGRPEELAELGAESGLDPAEVLEALERRTYLDAVEEDRRTAARIGISGVPFFVIDGRYGISGAQPPEAFVQVLSDIAAER
jgi:predicted DsbA family dithiol-disulfide isomerase